MDFPAIRALLLGQHVEIKRLIRQLEAIALRGAAGDRKALAALDAAVATLLEKLAVHTAAEDAHLASFPFDPAVWGPERLEQLRRLHAGAHDSMNSAAAEAADAGRPPASRAAGALTLVTALREHMRVEEKYLLGETVADGSAILDELAG